ncbi:MAG: homoserine dehydrogenase [Elusimicrobiota bacterium]|jgi:homoserine dehydrogenase
MKGPSIGVAVAGLGNVGREVARLLLARRASFRAALGADLRLAAVCDRRAAAEARRLGLPSSVRRTADWRELLGDPSVGVVVELFGGGSAARSLALAALRSGRRLVTANKLLVSERWPELARAAGGPGRLYYEASVAGAIPVLQALREGLAADRILSLRGILNGTTNFVLTEMIHGGKTLPEALARARALGLAERDASLDLGGHDAAHKLSVLASTVAGRWLPPRLIERAGIEALEPRDIRFALDKLGRTPRLVGTLVFDGGRVEAGVGPALVPLRHPLAGVHGATTPSSSTRTRPATSCSTGSAPAPARRRARPSATS